MWLPHAATALTKEPRVYLTNTFYFFQTETLDSVQRRCPIYLELSYKHCVAAEFYASKFQLDLAGKQKECLVLKAYNGRFASISPIK